LQSILVPVSDKKFKRQLENVKEVIRSEVNVKELRVLEDSEGILVTQITADFKKLGPTFGKEMKAVSAAISQMDQKSIAELEKNGRFNIEVNGNSIAISSSDVEITSEDIPGWTVANDGKYTVALDVSLS